jgi:hypothetical protein
MTAYASPPREATEDTRSGERARLRTFLETQTVGHLTLALSTSGGGSY